MNITIITCILYVCLGVFILLCESIGKKLRIFLGVFAIASSIYFLLNETLLKYEVYTIGVGGDYATYQSALNDYRGGCVRYELISNICEPTTAPQNTNEAGQNNIQQAKESN